MIGNYYQERKAKMYNKCLNDLNYILDNLRNNIEKAENLEDKMYFELSKEEIIKFLTYVYKKMSNWANYFKIGNYDLIINDYTELDSIISELSLCLADYENIFHMDGISYSLSIIGINLKKNKLQKDAN